MRRSYMSSHSGTERQQQAERSTCWYLCKRCRLSEHIDHSDHGLLEPVANPKESLTGSGLVGSDDLIHVEWHADLQHNDPIALAIH